LSTFVPRYDEIGFALDVWADLPQLLPRKGLEESDVSDVIDQAGRFAAEVLAPIDRCGDKEGCRLENGRVTTPPGWAEAYRAYVEAQWNTAHFDASIGGQGLPLPVATAVSEMFNAANIAFGLALMPFPGVVTLLDNFGTERQKRLYLPALVSGRWTATLAITESQAGTDLGAIKAKAVLDGELYRLYGEKIFITYGEHEMCENIVHFVLARAPGGGDGVKALSLYISPKYAVREDGTLGEQNDVLCVGLEDKMGIHGSPTATLVFGPRHGAHAELLGQENRGLEHMFVVLNRARLNIGIFGLSSAERAYQAALVYAEERIQGRDQDGNPCPIIRHPDVRRMILDMESCVDAMRALAYYTAALADRAASRDGDPATDARQRRLDLLTPIVKGWITEAATQVASTGVQVAGGAGYINGVIAQCFRDARVHTIYEGTTGVQSSDLVFRKVTRDSGVSVLAMLADMRQIEDSICAASETAELWPILARAIDSLDAATRWILGQAVANRKSVEAVAVHYLMLFGYTAAGWLLMKGAVEANTRYKVKHGKLAYDKTDRARFFLIHRLLPATALGEVVMRGSEVVLHNMKRYLIGNSCS